MCAAKKILGREDTGTFSVFIDTMQKSKPGWGSEAGIYSGHITGRKRKSCQYEAAFIHKSVRHDPNHTILNMGTVSAFL